MVSMLAFALLAADPAARFGAFMKAHPTFVATFDVSAGGQVGTETLRVNRPRRMRFDVKGPGIDYSISSTEKGYVEIDRVEQSYDEHDWPGGMRIFESRLAPGARNLFPRHLLPTSATGIFGANKTTVTPTEGGDEIRTRIETPMGVVEIRLLVDSQGRPARFSEGPPDKLVVWRLKSFRDGSPDLANYRLEAPVGYVPFALPELPYPLQIGEAAPLTGWTRSGKSVDLAEPQRGKTRLLAVLGSDCPASRAVRPSLQRLAQAMPVHIIGPGEIVDPSGTLMKRLSPPGTPMFYMVGPDGKVIGLWLGFDAAKATTWESELREAAQEKRKA